MMRDDDNPMTKTTRTVFTAEDFEHLANSMEWPEDFRALSQAAAQARVIEKLKAWLPTLREQPGIPTVGQIERRLADLLTEEGLTQ